MKLVYLGTPDVAVAPLEALVAAGHDIVLVVTSPDKRRGRGSSTSPSPVKAAAQALGLSVSHSVDDVVNAVESDGAELGVVVAFGQLIRPHILEVVPMVNLHFSLLPRWRGAAPVERALLAGDEVTGVCVMQLDEGLDTGGIYARKQVIIGAEQTAAQLRDELVDVGAALVVEQLSEPVEQWVDKAVPQTGDTTYASKFGHGDFEIDWSNSAEQVHRLVRVGGAWTTFRGQRLKILRARLDQGRFFPLCVQPAGKSSMSFDSWRNGFQPTSAELFGDL